MDTVKLAEIRAAYPAPVVARKDYIPGEYCVGGAYMLAHGDSRRFPTDGALWDATRRMVLFSEITLITAANDRGDYEEAWRLLGVAMGEPA